MKEIDDRIGIFLRSLLLISKNSKLPDVDFFISTHDKVSINTPIGSAPLFTFALNKNFRSNLVLVPDPLTLCQFGSLYYEILYLNDQINWENKINKAYWRGSTTGLLYDPNYLENRLTSNCTADNYQKFPRVILVDQSQKYSDLIDAKFTNYVQMDEETKKLMISKYGVSNSSKKKEQLKYKVQITIDGNSSTYPGFLWRLLSNSVNIKQESDEIQWFYRIVKPNIHYVPVKNDLSNIIQQIEWINNNDSEAKQISENARKLVQENLKITDIYHYIYVLLREYSKIQNFKVEINSSYIEVN